VCEIYRAFHVLSKRNAFWSKSDSQASGNLAGFFLSGQLLPKTKKIMRFENPPYNQLRAQKETTVKSKI
jgi:hypothetical protein